MDRPPADAVSSVQFIYTVPALVVLYDLLFQTLWIAFHSFSSWHTKTSNRISILRLEAFSFNVYFSWCSSVSVQPLLFKACEFLKIRSVFWIGNNPPKTWHKKVTMLLYKSRRKRGDKSPKNMLTALITYVNIYKCRGNKRQQKPKRCWHSE